jgi:cation diffusion facilitator CzcD-associated flavoprotein CzcO
VIKIIQSDEISPWQVRYCQNDRENLILQASSVVVATGKYKIQKRGINDFMLSKLEENDIPSLHSTELKDEATWEKALDSDRSGRLCIVGFGNSASDMCANILSKCDMKVLDISCVYSPMCQAKYYIVRCYQIVTL